MAEETYKSEEDESKSTYSLEKRNVDVTKILDFDLQRSNTSEIPTVERPYSSRVKDAAAVIAAEAKSLSATIAPKIS